MTREKWRWIFWCVTHPRQLLGGLAFFAALEGAFGAPAGAQRLLGIVLCVCSVFVLCGFIGICLWLFGIGYVVKLLIGTVIIGLLLWLVDTYWKT